MITSAMLLGVLKKRSKNKRRIKIEYYPFNNEEKLFIFNEVKDNRLIDIYYPYKYRDYYSNKEETSPDTGWSFNPEKKEYLGYGEVHFREFTKKYLESLKTDYKIVYDPACSTGEFLSDYKKSFKSSHTIGHDLSKEMIDYAKDYVDEALCCNAIDSPLKNNSVDLMFLRFLNSEVVTTKMAYKIFKVLVNKVRKNGLIIAFGHTPLLIRKEEFMKYGLEPIICNGYDKKRNDIFQYYVLRVR